MKKLALVIVLLAASIFASAQTATVAPIRYLSGLEPDKFSTNKLNINAGLLVGSVNPGSEFSNGGALNIRVDSLRRMEYRVDPGVMLFIRVLGYSMTEPA